MTSHNEKLRITVFGGLQVFREGRLLPLPSSRKARSMFAYLIMTKRPIRRERLCELFWDLPDDPRASLRWALSQLRTALNTPAYQCIRADRERVMVDQDCLEVDFLKARQELFDKQASISISDLVEMAEALIEPVLDGLDGSGTEDFDAWLTGEREDARLMRNNALQRLSTHRELLPADRVKWAFRWFDLMPLEPQAAANLISVYRATGRLNDAKKTELKFRKEAREACVALPADFARVPEINHSSEPQTENRQRWRLRSQRIGFCKARDHTNIAYAQVGNGPPLVKAANWLNHLELDWNSPIWGQTFSACAHARRFIRYDGRGNGLSDWNVKDIDMDSFVTDLETVVDALELERFPLLGISQGCAVSIEFAARHPERVSGLVLISGYATGWRVWADEKEKESREAVMTLTRNGWGTPNPAYRQIFSQTFMPDAKPEELNWFNEFQRQSTSPENAVRFLDAFGDIDVRESLPKVQAPTIIFHSRGDQRVSFDQARELAAGIRKAEIVPLDSRNHIVLGSEPAWRICRDRMRAFFHRYHI